MPNTTTNQCNTITLFPLTVVCNSTNPTNGFPNGSITLEINGGTPPYTVTWETGNIGESLYNLPAGTYQANVTDYYNDFSVDTFCTLVNIGPTPTPTPSPSPTPTVVEYDLCLSTDIIVEGESVVEQTTFNPYNIINGRQSWISADLTKYIIWDNVNSQWFVSGTSFTIISNNPAYPPTNTWNVIGDVGNANVTQGVCDILDIPIILGIGTTTTTTIPVPQLVSEISINHPTCGCDGGLSVKVKGGTPPYEYSINNGLTYSKMPIFSNLCHGMYILEVKDSLDVRNTGTIMLDKPSNPVTYLVKLSTSERTIQQTGSLLTKEYYTELNITPELPSGTTLTFDLLHLHSLKSSPNQLSSSATSTSDLYVDAMLFPVSFSSQTSGTSVNNVAGCQDQNVYIDSFTENWTGVSYTYGSELYIQTTVSTYQNESLPCYVGLSDEKFFISNLEISGCSCCTAIIV
jgi:hypothetical protein